MKPTTNLKLQKPEAGDVYNSSVITKNVETIDKYMANVGGNVPVKVLTDTTQFITAAAGFNITSGSLRIFGNGLAFIEVNFRTTVEMNVNQYGLIGGGSGTRVGNVLPEYAPAVTQPLTSGGIGVAVAGYITPNSPVVELKQLKGYFATGKIPNDSFLQLAGIYPLANVPVGIGLEQMPNKSFDHAVHERNLKKIDTVADKLKLLLPAKTFAQAESITATFPFTINTFSLVRNSNGMMDMDVRFRPGNNNSLGATGDVSNTIMGTLLPEVRPKSYIKLFSTHTGVILHGEINPNNGQILFTSGIGRDYIIQSDEDMQFRGTWVYGG